MASINVNPDQWFSFIARWFFGGIFFAIGWAVANALVIPHVPGI